MFIRGPNPIWYEFNQTGSIFNDTYYAFFLTNDLPYVPLAVYEDPNGTIPWSNPIEFQPSGGLPNNLYFDPSQVYRIEFRQGPLDTDPLIGNPIENYVPGSGSSSGTLGNTIDNLITNPTFSDINFTSPLTITTAGTYNIAPGWNLVLTGTGSATVTQTAVAGSSELVYNPSYYLTVANTGWTTIQLVQTLTNNGAIFQNGAIFGAFTAMATSNAQNIIVEYVPSTISGAYPVIINSNVQVGSFIEYKGGVDVPATTNTDLPPNATVKIVFNLIVGGTISLTNIQITGQETALSDTFTNENAPSYQEISYERMVDHEFHYYKPWLSYKPIPSLLVGWDFSLNPAQFFDSATRSVPAQAVGAFKSYYLWDQTILFQTANSAIVATSGDYGSLHLTAQLSTRIALIQYIPNPKARELLNEYLSVNIAALASANLKCTVSLWYTKDVSLPSTVGSNNSLVLTLTTDGKPATFNGNWIEVPRTISQDATFTVVPATNSNFNDYNFDGWYLGGISDTNAATYFAIVIGTDAMDTDQVLEIQSVGLMNGNIATRPAPQTYDEVLRECQYYYEKSFVKGVAPALPLLTGAAPVTSVNEITVPLNTFGGADLYLNSVEFNYKQTKYQTPILYLWSPATGAASALNVTVYKNGSLATRSGGAAASNPYDQGIGGNYLFTAYIDDFIGICQDTTTVQLILTTTLNEAFAQFHYVLDARLGQ